MSEESSGRMTLAQRTKVLTYLGREARVALFNHIYKRHCPAGCADWSTTAAGMARDAEWWIDRGLEELGYNVPHLLAVAGLAGGERQ